EQGEKVVGFMIYELHKAKLHILNFAVHPTCRRSRVGTQMVAKLISKLSSHRRTRITLEVRETNLGAQLFFRQQGFRAVRVLRSYYEDSGEDAFLMQYRLADDTGEEIEETVNRIAQFEESCPVFLPSPQRGEGRRIPLLSGEDGTRFGLVSAVNLSVFAACSAPHPA